MYNFILIIGYAIGFLIGLAIVAGIVYSILDAIISNKTISAAIASIAVILLNIKIYTHEVDNGLVKKAAILSLIIVVLFSMLIIFGLREEEKKKKEKEYKTITENDLNNIKQDSYLETFNTKESVPSNSNEDNNTKL